MNCPYCNFKFNKLLLAGAKETPDMAPALCEKCGQISLIESGKIRKVLDVEMEALKQSYAYRMILKPIPDLIARTNRHGDN